MITLITGVPGAGKTLRAVFEIEALRKQGRAVFSDIAGHCAPGILPAPDDWRDTPEGSVVVYDEAQKKYPSTGKPGVAQDERIRALETHRHTGHDVFFITQEPALIHHHIRKLVGRHIHVHRAAGLRRATLFTWDFAVSAPNDRNEQKRADTENWQYPKDLFRYYKSATVHTHKFQIPKKIAAILAVCVVVVGFVAWRIFDNGGLAFFNAAEAKHERSAQAAAVGGPVAPAPQPLQSSLNSWAYAPSVPAVIGCVGTETTCRCFGKDGAQLDLDLGTCLNVLTKPLPINVLTFSQNSGPGGAGGAPPAITAVAQSPEASSPGGPAGTGTPPNQVGPPGDRMSKVW